MTGATTSSFTPPHSPKTAEDDLFDCLRLLRSRRVGVMTFYRLINEYGSARAALEALPVIARESGVADYSTCPEGVVVAELRAGKAAGARLITWRDPVYPVALKALADAPPLLWTLGDLSLLARPTIAVVGARNASSLGLRVAKKLAGDLGEAGFAIVSGLARGIDAAAHLAALKTGTLAVQAGGIDVIYPAENAGLTHDLAKHGLRLTEQPMGLEPQARHFPQRNRIIAGLSKATLVIEAAPKSGSLITAEAAAALGREVFAVPGHPFDMRASGCNILIRDGANLARGAQDVIDVLGAPLPQRQPISVPDPASRTALQDASALHSRILERIGHAPIAEDQLIRDLTGYAGTIGPALIDLEMAGRIERLSGGLLTRTDKG